MFEVGKRYEFRMFIFGEETHFGGTVETYDHPLIKLADKKLPAWNSPPRPDKRDKEAGATIRGEIINVTSPAFISALIKD